MRLPLLSFILSLLLGFSSLAVAQSGKPEKLPELMNLQSLAIQSKQSNLPIMLMFGADWCPFCHTLVDEVLNPMMLGGKYEGIYMYMRRVGTDLNKAIPGIDGQPLQKRLWAEELRADLVPTVLFIDGHGKEVAPRIIGITNIEFYPALIHRSLNIAYKNMGNSLTIPIVPNLMK